MNLQEPKGVHPLFNKNKPKMDSIRVNYKKENKIEAELENVNIENYLRFDYGGNFVFKKCEYCTGLLLGHFQPKCPRVEYDADGVRRFEDHIQNIGGFDAALKRREMTYWKNRAEWSRIETRTSRTAGETTQLVKPRPEPVWIGQKFDKWKDEITTWNRNNRSSDEDKFLDMMESLKKNAGIKEFVNRTLIEKIGDTRTVDRIMEIMSEKFDRNMGEKTLEVMKKISGEGFKSDESVDEMLDRF